MFAFSANIYHDGLLIFAPQTSNISGNLFPGMIGIIFVMGVLKFMNK
jgi:hypothetical protein